MTHQVYLPDDVWGEVKDFLIPPKKPENPHPTAQVFFKDFISQVNMLNSIDSVIPILRCRDEHCTDLGKSFEDFYIEKYGIDYICDFIYSDS